ncbi:DUF7659 family protein [Cellvibrio sp. QJXJ]|uniref:DUF7659 family protein n=1 Tax=Cellvibrio sp. QJXJ TaxID=2964606 RepID=UPI0021C28679|nr:hypothetical protein [Cellvibrio sp. QJXJ]UUA75158.1 hypothetical protein NNX04_22130 [Cellvibrio sp. QJXJ]
MKYLSDYINEMQSGLFALHGAFFALGKAQFEERRIEGVEYCTLTNGIIVPVVYADALAAGLVNLIDSAISHDLEENGKDCVIARELHNHECFIDGGVSRCIDALEGYGITRDEVLAVFKEISATYQY